MDAAGLKALLEASFPGGDVTVEDLTGTDDHFRVRVVSARFTGKSALDRHRMVYEAVGERMTREIHALTIETATP